MNYKTVLFAIIFISGCATTEPINEIPMYGNLPKSQELIGYDQKFIYDVVKQFGSRDSACKVHIHLGNYYLGLGDPNIAIKRFNQAWLLDSTNADVYWGFAYSLEKKDRYKEAIPMFEKAIHYAQDNYKIWIGYAVCYSLIADKEGNKSKKEEFFKKSELLFEKTEKMNDKSGDLYFGWAQKWHKQGNEEKANFYLQKAKDLGFQR